MCPISHQAERVRKSVPATAVEKVRVSGERLDVGILKFLSFLIKFLFMYASP